MTPPLTRADWQRAKAVDQDLAYLIEDWRPSFDEGGLRRDSPILRRLLVDGEYARAWRDIGLPGQPYISAPDFATALGETTREYVTFAVSPPGNAVTDALSSGGGDISFQFPAGATPPIGSVLAVAGAYGQRFGMIVVMIPPDKVPSNQATSVVTSMHLKPGRRWAIGRPVSAFLSSQFALILGQVLTRQDVIQYVANKLGGAHFDAGRTRKGDERLEYLDKLSGLVVSANARPLNFVYVELQSIAEWISESGDAARFRDVFQKIKEPT